ncbi:MAG: DUF3237 domain-containing protein [Burkholderiales bacterium]|nr:DUF3237 domain-containing protein [Burkholderiales bacterium]
MKTAAAVLCRFTLAACSLLLAAWLPTAHAQTTQPKLEYLMTYKALLEPGYAIDNTLVIVNVLPGGWAKGPNINGSFIPPGGDWLRVMPAGVLRLDVRATLKTDEGDLIYVTYNGIIQHSEASAAKLNAGEKFTHKDIDYFVTAPTFQTASKKYDYLNRVQIINKFVEARLGKGGESYVMYDVFVVK